jgi:hypothetical protein
MVDEGLFTEPGIGKLSDCHFELAFVLANRTDPRRDRTAIGDLVGRGFDLRTGRKSDRDSVLGIAVFLFLPTVGDGGSAEGEGCQNQGDRAHLGFLLTNVMCHRDS